MAQLRLETRGYRLLMLAGLLLLGIAAITSLSLGTAELSPGAIVNALLGQGDTLTQRIVLDLRLARLLAGILVGSGLAVSGAGLQAIMHNPLAEPYVLGISSGASVGVILAVSLGLENALLRAGLGFGGGLLAVFVVYRIATVGRHAPPGRLLLAGVAFSAFGGALSSLLFYLQDDALALRGLMFWLMGGLSWIDLESLSWVVIPVLIGSFSLLILARRLNLLLLGDESALSLGLRLRQTQRIVIFMAALSTGALVSIAGSIGFVGLVVPHALRPLTGPDHRRLLPACLVFGALLLTLMDLGARVIIAPDELPVGVLTGLIGAPFFLLLLRQGSPRDV